MTLKVLTLHQPWATFILAGLKTFETRSWWTSHRGLLGIHASLRRPVEGWGLLDQPAIVEAAVQAGLSTNLDDYPVGQLLGTVQVLSCRQASPVFRPPTKLEGLVGDWTDGRWVWELATPVAFDAPVALPGRQGIWHWAGLR